MSGFLFVFYIQVKKPFPPTTDLKKTSYFVSHPQWFAAYHTAIRPTLLRRLGRAAAGKGLFFLDTRGNPVANPRADLERLWVK